MKDHLNGHTRLSCPYLVLHKCAIHCKTVCRDLPEPPQPRHWMGRIQIYEFQGLNSWAWYTWALDGRRNRWCRGGGGGGGLRQEAGPSAGAWARVWASAHPGCLPSWAWAAWVVAAWAALAPQPPIHFNFRLLQIYTPHTRTHMHTHQSNVRPCRGAARDVLERLTTIGGGGLFWRSTIEVRHCGPILKSKCATPLFGARLFQICGCHVTVWAYLNEFCRFLLSAFCDVKR